MKKTKMILAEQDSLKRFTKKDLETINENLKVNLRLDQTRKVK